MDFPGLGAIVHFSHFATNQHILSVARLLCFLFNQNNQSNGI